MRQVAARGIRPGPLLHFCLALWGIHAFWRLYRRSRVVPVVLSLGPWREPVYPPWLLFCLALCGLVALWRAGQGIRALLAPPRSTAGHETQEVPKGNPPGPGGPETPGKTSPCPPSRRSPYRLAGRNIWKTVPSGVPGLGWPDWVLGGATTLIAWQLLDAFRRARNPLGACVGMDAPTFLGDIVAVGLGRWDLYNTDKRLPYPWISASLADWTGLSYLEAGQAVSFASAVLLVLVVYLMARAFAGRLTAVLAALLHLSLPILHPYAVQTSSYAFFYLVVNAMVAASAWAVATGGKWLYCLAGVLAVVSVGTQVKGLTVVVPVVCVVVVWTLARGLRASMQRLGWFAFPTVIGALLSSHLPVQYTPLSWLIAHHREEVHQDLPYDWPKTMTPSVETPSVLSRWLPDSLRGGEIEALAAVMLAPPNADVVVFQTRGPGDADHGPPRILPGTTIPPLAIRIARNLEGLVQFFPDNRLLLLLLLAAGVFGALIPLPRNLPPVRRCAGWILVGALTSVWGPLSLKFHIRYLLQALPAAAVLLVHGVQSMARQWTGHAPRPVRAASALMVAWFVGSVAGALFCQSTRIWPAHGATPAAMSRCIGIHDKENNTRQGWAVMSTAAWLKDHVPPGALIVDCSPIPIWHYLPNDPRMARPAVDGERLRACRRLIEAIGAGTTPERPVFVVVSDVSEYRGPDTPHTRELLSHPEHWSLVYGANPETWQTLQDAARYRPTHNAVLVFRAGD